MRTALSIHTYITVLVVATILPFLVFSGVLVDRSSTSEQETIARTVQTTAQSAAADVYRALAGLQSLALALADARPLKTGDLAAFHDEAGELLRRQDVTAVLYDPAGQQLVDTSLPSGTDLPADPTAVLSVVETGQTDISDLRMDSRTGKPVVRIAVPVTRDDKLVYVLALQISNVIAGMMAQQVIPSEQIAGLIDRQGLIIGRSRDADQFVGLPAAPDALRAFDGLDEGSFRSITRAGVPSYVAFSRVKLAGWVLAVSIPRHVLFAPATRSLHRLLALGGFMLLLAGLLAWRIGSAIATPVGGLSRLALALGSGEHEIPPPLSRIREVDEVTAAMLSASASLVQQTEQRASATMALKVETDGRRGVERQLVQAQKMEAVGQLTGGLAHDFNNLLAIVIGNLDELRERCANDAESNELADSALAAALRGAELTRQMLAFARRQPLAPARCNINQAIRVIVGLLSRMLGEDIVIDLQLAEDLWPVLIDEVQFEAAITNLATNARHAMPDGGQLTIVTRNTFLDDDYAASHAEVSSGAYVTIEVSDTGCGMPADIVEHIFEPFFTTKEPGLGTGLGLSMVFGFLKQSGGHINAYSEIGQGSTFRLYLPPARGAGAPDRAVATPAPARGRNETILVVEDSAGLRKVLARQLNAAGYRVIEAENAKAALDTIETGAAIDLLFTDIVMPGGMNGHELVRMAVQRRPNLKTLLTTGFSEATNGGAASPPDGHVLRKPYRKDEMLRLVREVLNT